MTTSPAPRIHFVLSRRRYVVQFALVGIVRKGRPDLIASVSLVTILLSLGLAAASDDTRVLQIRESYITLIMGLVFVISSVIRKPILWLLARHQAKSEEQRRALEHPSRRKMLGTVNAVWGWSFVLEFAAKLWMIENLPISRVLALSPIMFYGVTAVTFVWTLWWLRRAARGVAEAEKAGRMAGIANSAANPGPD